MSYAYQQQRSSKGHGLHRVPKAESYGKHGSDSMRFKEVSVLGPEDAASLVSHLENPRSFLNAAPDADKIKAVESLFHKAAMIGVGLWLVLMFVVFLVSPNDSYVEPLGFDQLCHVVCGTLLVVSNGARLLPIILKEKGFKILKNGFIVGSLSVQLIALASNYIMAFKPTPVMFDEISGLHFHMVRWAEFVALAFLMAFLTINVDASFKGTTPTADFVFPATMALSTSAGMIFPFCQDQFRWWTIMCISWALFCMIYVVTFRKAVEYLELKGEIKAGTTRAKANAQQAERLEISKSGFNLALSITISWTGLALAFTFLSVVTKLARKDSWASNPHLLVIVTCGFEVISKIWYLGALFEAYRKVFDEQVRSHRRLDELRSFMSAVWVSSSDVIVFCSKNGDSVTARVSPAFFATLGKTASDLGFDPDEPTSLVLEIDPSQDVFSVAAMDLDQAITRSDLSSVNTYDRNLRAYRISKAEDVNAPEANLARMAKLALDACTLAPALLDSRINPTKFVARAGRKGLEISEISCEVHISLLESRSCVLTLRDISERLHRFQVEKKLVKEVTSRKKDEEANRFTRHEVKNALLASMGILDHLKDLLQRANVIPTRNVGDHVLPPDSSSMSFLNIGADDDSVSPQIKEVDTTVNELDATLKDIMDTVLDEAMAREIIYGDYTARKERVNVPDVLASLRRGASRRFPMEVVPSGPLFPILEMDRQLLRYIYRNAVSNACKHGRKDGVVNTRIAYDPHLQLLTMQIVNLPGEGHDKLCKLSAAEVEKVFEKNTRLGGKHGEAAADTESSGGGAWIMKQCADVMGGRLDIKFEKTRTVFSFSFGCATIYMPERISRPAAVVNVSGVPSTVASEDFTIPEGTWGVVIDDSRIQRKVLGTFMQLIGIDKARQLILGATKDEIHGFGDSVKNLLRNNPNDKFLLIVDENLDIVDGGTRHETVSGSISVQKLLAELDPASKARVLALVRSANDSDMDIQVYKKRAHGHLRKEPLQKSGNLELIKPWWMDRFGSGTNNFDDSTSFNNSLEFGVADDVREALGVISALAVVASDARWHAIREKLHGLKGDLKATMPMATIGPVVAILDELMASDSVPRDFNRKWVRLESEIEAILVS